MFVGLVGLPSFEGKWMFVLFQLDNSTNQAYTRVYYNNVGWKTLATGAAPALGSNPDFSYGSHGESIVNSIRILSQDSLALLDEGTVHEDHLRKPTNFSGGALPELPVDLRGKVHWIQGVLPLV